eukprot:15419905-Alexandrium_andersonii.AAC.1
MVANGGGPTAASLYMLAQGSRRRGRRALQLFGGRRPTDSIGFHTVWTILLAEAVVGLRLAPRPAVEESWNGEGN